MSKRVQARMIGAVTFGACLTALTVAWISGCRTTTPASPASPAAPPAASADVPPMPIITADETHRFVGSKPCAGCHKEAARAHQTSMHAHTLALAAGHSSIKHFETDQVVDDPALSVNYSFKVKDGKPVTRVARATDGATEELSPRYVLGSGYHGYTFLFERDDRYLESRLSYYPPAKRWAWTPGQEQQTPFRAPMGRLLEDGEAFSCFICHSTTLVHEGETPRPEKSIFNVGCERCHGAGKEHVEAARTNEKPGSIFRYGGAGADTIMRLCGECHRSPQTIPADQLETHVDLPRFAGTALAASKCFQKSNGKLSCVSCHDPHAGVSRNPATYERVCMSCHNGQATAQKPCPVNPKSGCIPCHLPAQSLGDPDEVKFHNHWIRIFKNAKKNH